LWRSAPRRYSPGAARAWTQFRRLVRCALDGASSDWLRIDTDRYVPAAWVASEHGVTVKRLPTYHGVLDLSLRAESVGSAFRRTLQLRLQTLQGRRTTYAKGTVVRKPDAASITTKRISR